MATRKFALAALALALMAGLCLSNSAWAADSSSDQGLSQIPQAGYNQMPLPGSPDNIGWATKLAINPAASRLTAAAVNGKIYRIGGEAGSAPTRRGWAQEYDPVGNAWTDRDTMPVPGSNLNCAVWNNKIYVPGGWTGSVAFNNLQVFDPASGTWTQETAMPASLFAPAVAVLGDTLYVIGGTPEGTTYLNSVYAYDLVGQTWSTKGSLNNARAYYGAAVVGGKIYAIGGRTSTTDLAFNEMYDPTTNSWTTKTAMPTARGGCGVLAIGGKIYVFGGGWTAYYNTVDVYDPQADTVNGTPWSTETAFPTGRRTVGVAAWQNTVYVLGGYGTGSYMAQNEQGSGWPQVTATDPADGNNAVAQNAPVVITFSKPVDPATFAYTCTPNPGGWSPSWNVTNDIVTLTHSNFTLFQSYVFTITDVHDANGMGLVAGPVPNPFTFTSTVPVYSIPFFEGFELGTVPPTDWTQVDVVGTAGNWTAATAAQGYPAHAPHTGTYQARFNSFSTSGGEQTRLITPKIDLGASGGKLDFWFYHDTGYTSCPESLLVEVSTDGGSSWSFLGGYKRYQTTSYWENAVLDLAAYANDTVMIGFRGKSYYGNDMFIDDINVYRSSYWVSHTTMNAGGYGHAVAGWNGRVYAFGGTGGGSGSTNYIRYYDTLSVTWTTTSTTLPQNLYYASAATVGDKIYIIGGSTVFATPVNTVYCYSPDGDSISTRASLPVATMEHACGVWRGTHIYVMGGGNWTMTPINNVQVYDIAADAWSAGTPMPAARGCLGGAVCGDYAVVACGNSSGSTWSDACFVGAIYPANPDSITWTTGAVYPGGPRARPSTLAYDGKLFLSSGFNGGFFGTTHNYDPATDIWTPMPDKTTPTVSAGQAALVGRGLGRWAYVVGGEAGDVNEALYLGSATGVEGRPVALLTKPAVLSLLPNYPNPVRGRTTIPFSLPRAGEYSFRVYNIAGQLVHNDGGRGLAGLNKLTWNAGRLSAGIYIFRISSSGQQATRKLVIVR